MSDGDRVRDRVESTNKSVMLMAAAGAGLAVLLLWLAQRESGRWSFDDTWQAIVSNIGGLVLATALITVAWELAGKRSFAREVMAKANLSEDVKRAGIAKVTDQYLDSVAWDELIDGSSKVDIVVAYASTWRNANRHRLLRVAARKGARIRVFLPDPEDAMTMSVLADRFSTTPQDLKSKVAEAIREFADLHTSGVPTSRSMSDRATQSSVATGSTGVQSSPSTRTRGSVGPQCQHS